MGVPLFAAQSSAQFNLQTALPPAFTFTRAGNGTFWNGSSIVTAGANVPRFEPAGGPMGGYGLLLEPSSTTLATYSTPGAGWTNTNVTVTTNMALSPDGTVDATLVSDTASSTPHYAQTQQFAVVSGQTYAIKIFLSAGTVSAAQVALFGTGFSTSCYVNVDLTSGILGTAGVDIVGSPTLTPIGGGIYCLSFLATAIASTFGYLAVVLTNGSTTGTLAPTYVGTGLGVNVWGAQAEQQAWASSAIVNASGSSLTRAADALYLPLTAALWWQNAAGMTAILEADYFGLTTNTVLLGVCGAGGFAAGAIYVTDVGGNLQTGVISGTPTGGFAFPTAGATTKIGLSIVPGGTVNVAMNGVAATAGVAPSLPTLTTLSIGGAPWSIGGSGVGMHARRLLLIAAPMSSAALAGMTA